MGIENRKIAKNYVKFKERGGSGLEVRNALWLNAYTANFNELYQNIFLHNPQSPYHDSNNHKLASELQSMSNLLRNSTEDAKSTNFLNAVTSTFLGYEKKTKDLTIALMLASNINDPEKEITRINSLETEELIRTLNKYYLNFRNGVQTNMTYNEEGYASPEDNLTAGNRIKKAKLEKAFNLWIKMIYNRKNFDGVDSSFKNLLLIADINGDNNKSKNLTEVSKALKNYKEKIVNAVIENNKLFGKKDGNLIKEFETWVDNKNLIIINQLSKIKGFEPPAKSKQNKMIQDALKKDKNGKDIYGTGLHIKMNTWQQDFKKVYRQAGLFTSVEEIGKACENDLANIFNQGKIVCNNKTIKFQAKSTGANKINGKTQTTDVELLIPTFSIEMATNSKRKRQKTINQTGIVKNNISYKNSIPDPDSPKFKTTIRTMNGIDNALNYYSNSFEKLKTNGKNLAVPGLNQLLKDDNRKKLSYFFVNEYFAVPNGEFDKNLRLFLSTIGEFFQFALLQSENEVSDQIDFMMINQKIVPSGFLWEKIFSYLTGGVVFTPYETTIKPQTVKENGKSTSARNGVGDNFGSFYKRPYSDTKGKNLVSKISITVKMESIFRTAIRKTLDKVKDITN